ncbi:MAG TPA: glutamate synthase subunit beta [Gammaproteobacteria bacterium]|nr:glutamate synthase subunit beta [Gammaproteobacteria bacterium]
MAKITGFLEFRREKTHYRPIEQRLRDWRQVMEPLPEKTLNEQAARCMDCGIPFCHQGCPLGNLIPDWNDLVYRERWADAIARLHATNNFPEFTGTLCPAPCEGSCVLGINDDPVTIKAVELAIVERAFAEGWIAPQPPAVETGRKVAIVGSGPAGLAAAQQLRRAGHRVTVFERDDRVGGLLRYGIPEFKMEKRVLDRRLAQLRAEGVEFRVNAHVGVDVDVAELKRDFHAVLLAGGATVPRDLPLPGRELKGVHFAMDYLTLANRKLEGDRVADDPHLNAEGKRVVIIGGGDTGADCLGTAHRQHAKHVTQLEILARPPAARAADNPWPEWPRIYRTSSAHEEGGDRVFGVSTKRFLGDDRGALRAIEIVDVELKQVDGRASFEEIPHTLRELPCELILLAMGFAHPERGLLEQFGVRITERGNAWRDAHWMTSVEGVFTAGDMQRGQSLIVWAIAEGRSAAAGIDRFLMGGTDLPAPLP